MKVIQFPSFNTTFDSLKRLEKFCDLYDRIVCSNEDNFLIVFDECLFITADAVAFLGGLVNYAKYREKNITFDFNSLSPGIDENLKRNKFLDTFANQSSGLYPGNAIIYRNDFTDSVGLRAHLWGEVLSHTHLALSERVKTKIFRSLYELFHNAFSHSASPVGVFSCGQFYPNIREFQLCVVDMGIGVIENVRRFRKKAMRSFEDLLWAFEMGNSTIGSQWARGLGLSFISELVKLNLGCMTMFTNDGVAKIDGGVMEVKAFHRSFQGTIVNLILKCDNSYYFFESERREIF